MLKLALRFALGSGESRAQIRARLHGKSRSKSRPVSGKVALGIAPGCGESRARNRARLRRNSRSEMGGQRARLFQETGWRSRSTLPGNGLGIALDFFGKRVGYRARNLLQPRSDHTRIRVANRARFSTKSRSEARSVPGKVALGIALGFGEIRARNRARLQESSRSESHPVVGKVALDSTPEFIESRAQIRARL